MTLTQIWLNLSHFIAMHWWLLFALTLISDGTVLALKSKLCYTWVSAAPWT